MNLDVETLYVKNGIGEIKSSQVFITPGNINGGFEYPYIKLVFISDKEVYGASKERIRKKEKEN